MKSKLRVPEHDEIVAMTTDALLEFRTRLVDASGTIQGAIETARASGDYDQDWWVRSQSALAHMRRGLGTVRAELSKRSGIGVETQASESLEAFQAVDTLRETVKAYSALLHIVREFVEDDSDKNFERLCAFVGIA